MYRPFSYLRMSYSNNRDHRKILVVDGEIGYTGGAGYADSWNGKIEDAHCWRDTQYALRGPAVAELQRAFFENWLELTGEKLSGEEYLPQVVSAGKVNVQVTVGSPMERGDTLGSSYLLAIDAAKESILIEHAYFTPNKELRDAMLRGRKRGVEIEVILPGEHIDAPLVRSASKIYWPELMRAGVKIYEFQPSMMHGKLIVVDDYLSIIGSGNFDDRTFFINDEVNVHVLDVGFAREQRRMFERDRKRCVQCGEVDAEWAWGELPMRCMGYLLMPML